MEGEDQDAPGRGREAMHVFTRERMDELSARTATSSSYLPSLRPPPPPRTPPPDTTTVTSGTRIESSFQDCWVSRVGTPNCLCVGHPVSVFLAIRSLKTWALANVSRGGLHSTCRQQGR